MSRLEVARAEVKRLQVENSRLRQARSDTAAEGIQRQLEETRERLRLQEVEVQELRTKCQLLGETQERLRLQEVEVQELRNKCQLLEETCKTVREEATREKKEYELERHRAVEAERAKWEERESRLIAQLDAARRTAHLEKREAAETPTQPPAVNKPKKPPRPSAVSEMRSASQISPSLQDGIKDPPTVVEQEQGKESPTYCNLSMGGHIYMNHEQAKHGSDVQYIKLPQMVANEEARKSLIRTPHQREVTEEEKSFMQDTWGVMTEGGTTFSEVPPEMRFSLGDLETDLVEKYLTTEEGGKKNDRDVCTGEGTSTSERGKVESGMMSSTLENDHSTTKFKSRLLRHSSDSVLIHVPFDLQATSGKCDRSQNGI